MIRVVIISGQSSLERLLDATLGNQFRVRVTADRDTVRRELNRGQVDIVVVDLDTRFASLEEQFAFLSELQDADLPRPRNDRR